MKHQIGHMTSVIIMAVLALLLSGSCSSANRSTHVDSSRERLDSLRSTFREYNMKGLYDSIILTARPVLHQALETHDTLAILYSGGYTAQAFLTQDKIDSAQSLMNLIGPYRKGGEKDPSLQTVLFALEGLLHLRTELNYTLALESFLEGCNWAEYGNDPNNNIVLLANTAHIFYVRGDSHGLEYAQKAYDISQRPDVAAFPRCQASLLMGQMLLLSDKATEAEYYLENAGRMIYDGDFKSLISIYSLLYADIYQSRGENYPAESCFKNALKWSGYAETGTVPMIYLDYGEFCQKRGMYDKALELYKSGLEVSYRHKNLEFRRELLSRIADLYQSVGNRTEAVEYSYLYKAYVDSIANLQKEREFNSRLMYYTQIEHEHEIQTRELELLQARKKTATVIFLSIIIIVIAISLSVMYIRQRKMNRTLVLQYENYIQRTHIEKTSARTNL